MILLTFRLSIKRGMMLDIPSSDKPGNDILNIPSSDKLGNDVFDIPFSDKAGKDA